MSRFSSRFSRWFSAALAGLHDVTAPLREIQILCLVGWFGVLVTPAHGAIRYVNTNATGANNGTSWANAYKELVSAINAAQAGDEIWVAAGIYYPDFNPATELHTGDRTLRFVLKANVSLFGGFNGTEAQRSQRDWATNRTILSGDIGQRGVFSDNTLTLLRSDNSATTAAGILVEGFVIAGGNANDFASSQLGAAGGYGGGVYLANATAEFRHCAIVGNYGIYAGGISVRGSPSQLTVRNCLFAGNSSQWVGGAIYFSVVDSLLTVANSTIVNNTSSRATAISSTYSGTTRSIFNLHNNLIHSNPSTSTGWEKVENEDLGTQENNILEEALIPPGINNLVVQNPKLVRFPSAGLDGVWGTMDDILDGKLAGDSPALNFGSVIRVPSDSTDLDGDGNTTEEIPFDLSRGARVLYGAPDAGAFEFVDLETFPPTLTSPVTGTRVKNPVSVSFRLSEPALAGSVTLTFDDGVTQRVLALAASQESVGTHSFTFDSANPVATSGGAIASGPAIPDGTYTVTLSYRDQLSHPPATASSAGVVIDNATQPPTLTAPASGLTTKSPVSISFSLPEAGLAGSLTLTFDDGITQRVLGLANSRAAAGAQNFTFNPATPTSSSGGAITSGSAIPEGIYSVTLSYRDAVGNTAATATAANVRLDLTTQGPTLTAPLAGTASRSPVNVGFSLPESALAGSVKLAFSGPVSRTLTLASSFESSGAKSFSFNPANPIGGAVVSILGGPTVPDGLYTVALSYQDALGNVSASASASSVRIDTTAPSFSLPGTQTVEATSAAGAVVLYSASASDSGSGVASAFFSPASGSTFPLGTTTVNATGTDNVGNVGTGSFSVIVRDTTDPVVAQHPNVTAEATSPGGAIVTFAPASVSDAVGVAAIAYSQSSGTFFPIGTTTVLIFATDAANNLGTGSFTVTVQDTTAPVVTPPGNLMVEATSAAGATVNFPAATATDAVGVTSLTYSQNSGTPFPVGTTTVTVTAKDAANNSGVATFSVTVRDATAPIVTPPGDQVVEATSAAGAIVNYPPAMATDDVGVTSLTYSRGAGAIFPLGNTVVLVTGKDAASNEGTATFSVKVEDTTPPAASVPGAIALTAGPTGTVVLGDLTGQVTRSDAVGVVAVDQSPAAGAVLPLGTHAVSFVVKDAAQNSTTVQTSVAVSFAPAQTPAEVNVAAQTGTAAPVTLGLPAEAMLASFGTPAVSDFREMAARVGMVAGRQRIAGVYVVDGAGVAELPAFQGGPVLDVAGAPLAGLTFKSFMDPVLAPGGAIAFCATLTGAKAREDQGVWTDVFGSLGMVLREGSGVPGLPAGVRLKSVTSLSLRDGSLVALVKLTGAKPAVTAGKDDVALIELTAPTTGQLLLRTGPQLAGSTARTIASLAPALGSAGQGRWHGRGAVLAKVTYSDQSVSLVKIASDGTQTVLLSSAQPADMVTQGAAWKGFGVPAMGGDGAEYAVLGRLKTGTSGVTMKEDEALLFSPDGAAWETFAREGATSGVEFASFLDPVVNAEGTLAFRGSVRESGKVRNALFQGVPGQLERVAVLGESASGPDGSATTALFSRWISYALPSGAGAGVVLLAEIKGGDTTAKNRLGLWARDSAKVFRRVLRTGEPAVTGGPLLTNLTLLNALPGSYGSPRSYNETASVAVLASFDDKSQALLRVDLP